MKQQTIIIIGATSGIGRALFEKYAADGNCIGIVGRRTHLLDELRQEYPDTTVIATADITKQDEIARAIESLRAELKDIDLAIVCSGRHRLLGYGGHQCHIGLRRGASDHRHQRHGLDVCHRQTLQHLRAARSRPPRRHHLGWWIARRTDGTRLQRIESLSNQLHGSPAQESL